MLAGQLHCKCDRHASGSSVCRVYWATVDLVVIDDVFVLYMHEGLPEKWIINGPTDGSCKVIVDSFCVLNCQFHHNWCRRPGSHLSTGGGKTGRGKEPKQDKRTIFPEHRSERNTNINTCY